MDFEICTEEDSMEGILINVSNLFQLCFDASHSLNSFAESSAILHLLVHSRGGNEGPDGHLVIVLFCSFNKQYSYSMLMNYQLIFKEDYGRRDSLYRLLNVFRIPDW